MDAVQVVNKSCGPHCRCNVLFGNIFTPTARAKPTARASSMGGCIPSHKVDLRCKTKLTSAVAMPCSPSAAGQHHPHLIEGCAVA
jgi:hypothetical protein